MTRILRFEGYLLEDGGAIELEKAVIHVSSKEVDGASMAESLGEGKQ